MYYGTTQCYAALYNLPFTTYEWKEQGGEKKFAEAASI
jgi:hypothetical protein